MQYRHTQRGPWYLILLVVACILVVFSLLTQLPTAAAIIFGCVAGLFVVLSLSFRTLTILDQGDRLKIQYGPLPLFHKSIPYDQITSVEPGQSSVIDGWGIHWIPGRGWTYNLWGFQCAVLHCGNRIVRIGSNDVEALVRFLQSRIAARSSSA